jgi:hypothetical protein
MWACFRVGKIEYELGYDFPDMESDGVYEDWGRTEREAGALSYQAAVLPSA